MTLFKDARARTLRANESIEVLKIEIKEFNRNRPYSIQNEIDIEKKEILLVYEPTAQIPERWQVIIGEIINNLRAALDYAVYELTILEEGKPLENTEFPIFESAANFSERQKNNVPARKSGLYKIRGLKSTTKAWIESIQPYNFRQPNQIPLLELLHNLDRVNKHRHLHLVRKMISYQKTESLRSIQLSGGLYDTFMGDINQRLILSRYKVSDPSTVEFPTDHVVIEIAIAFEATFVLGFNLPQEVIEVLTILKDHVDDILNNLEKHI